MPAARRTRSAITPKGTSVVSASARPTYTAGGVSLRARRAESSRKSRDLPAPHAPSTSIAPAMGSAAQSSQRRSTVSSSRSRPTKGRCPPITGGGRVISGPAPARARAAPSCSTAKRGPSAAAVASSRRTTPGGVPRSMITPKSMSSPPTRRAATTPRPVTTQIGSVGARARSARAESAARSVRSAASPLLQKVITSERPACRSICPPNAATTPARSGTLTGSASSPASPSASGSVSRSSPARTRLTSRRSRWPSEGGGIEGRERARTHTGTGVWSSSMGTMAASAAATAAASGGRSSGSDESMRCTRSSSAPGRSGRSAASRGDPCRTIFASTLMGFSPANAGRPVRHS